MPTDDGDSGSGDRRTVSTPADGARAHVLDEHGDLVARVSDCADRVAAAWDSPPTGRTEVVEPLSAVLAETGALDRLPELLVGAVDAAGYDLQAAPVPAPPYVAVTSVGPVCRATVTDGRLVVAFELFDVDRSGDRPTYRRRDSEPAESVVVELRD